MRTTELMTLLVCGPPSSPPITYMINYENKKTKLKNLLTILRIINTPKHTHATTRNTKTEKATSPAGTG